MLLAPGSEKSQPLQHKVGRECPITHLRHPAQSEAMARFQSVHDAANRGSEAPRRGCMQSLKIAAQVFVLVFHTQHFRSVPLLQIVNTPLPALQIMFEFDDTLLMRAQVLFEVADALLQATHLPFELTGSGIVCHRLNSEIEFARR